MKAFRSRPSIMINRREENKKAELAIQNLRLSFGGVVAVKDVDLQVHTGELMAIIGPNGETLQALRHLLRVMARKITGETVFIDVDVNGYLKKRKDYLRQLALSRLRDAKSE